MADTGNHILGLAVVGGTGEDIGGTNQGLRIACFRFFCSSEVGVEGQIGRIIVHVNVAEQSERGQLSSTHSANNFKILRGLEGLFVANQGITLKEPVVSVVGVVFE